MENLNVASAANGMENRRARRSEQNPSMTHPVQSSSHSATQAGLLQKLKNYQFKIICPCSDLHHLIKVPVRLQW